MDILNHFAAVAAPVDEVTIWLSEPAPPVDVPQRGVRMALPFASVPFFAPDTPTRAKMPPT